MNWTEKWYNDAHSSSNCVYEQCRDACWSRVLTIISLSTYYSLLPKEYNCLYQKNYLKQYFSTCERWQWWRGRTRIVTHRRETVVGSDTVRCQCITSVTVSLPCVASGVRSRHHWHCSQAGNYHCAAGNNSLPLEEALQQRGQTSSSSSTRLLLSSTVMLGRSDGALAANFARLDTAAALTTLKRWIMIGET